MLDIFEARLKAVAHWRFEMAYLIRKATRFSPEVREDWLSTE
jgi:hypothetical protein